MKYDLHPVKDRIDDEVESQDVGEVHLGKRSRPEQALVSRGASALSLPPLTLSYIFHYLHHAANPSHLRPLLHEISRAQPLCYQAISFQLSREPAAEPSPLQNLTKFLICQSQLSLEAL